MFSIFQALKSVFTSSSVSFSSREVFDILEHLKNSDTHVNVKFFGSDFQFEGKVTAVNQQHRIMVISDLTPEPNSMLLKAGTGVQIFLEKDNRLISFLTTYQEPLVSGADLGLQFRIPPMMSTSRERGAFRVLVEQQENTAIVLKTESDTVIEGKIDNLSATGARVITLSDELHIRDYMNSVFECVLHLKENQSIKFLLEVLNVEQKSQAMATVPCSYNDKTQASSVTCLGGRFLNMSKRDKQKLLEYLGQVHEERMSPQVLPKISS